MRIKKLSKGPGLLKSFSVYLFSALFGQAVNFLLLPLFTHYLTPSDYGVLSLANTAITILSVLIMCGADGSIRRNYYKLEGADYTRYFSSAFYTTVSSFLLVGLLVALMAPWTGGFLGLPHSWLLLLPVIGFTAAVPNILLGQYRVMQKAPAFGIFSNLMSLTNIGLAVWLVSGARLGYEGRLYSILATNALFAGIALFVLVRRGLLFHPVDRTHFRASLRYGLPLIPHQLSALAIAFSDRFFIARIVGIDETGIYNIGYTVGSIISVLEGTFGYAFTPFLFEQLKADTPESRKKAVRASYLFLGALAVCVLGLSFGAGLLFDWFTDERYHAGKVFVPVVAAGYFFSGCYRIVSGYIFYSGRTVFLTYLALFNLTLSLILNYVLIHAFGAMGAAYATVISLFAMFVVTAVIANRLIPMPWLYFLRGGRPSA